MANLEVVFSVPESIEIGLATGTLERVGGVIVEKSSKQIVAWLRDGANISDSYRRIQSLASLSTFTVAGQVLNLSLAATSFVVMMQRLDKLSEQVSNLSQLVQAEFARDRDTNFKVALQAACDVFESDNRERHQNTVRNAIDGLYAAREHFLADFRQVINKDVKDADRLMIAQHHLVRAMYAEMARIRCYLESGDLNLAKQRLSDSVQVFRDNIRSLVRLWLGEHPALFLHKLIPSEDVTRFMRIQHWLHSIDESSENDIMDEMIKIINNLRVDFWNFDIMQDEYEGDIFRQITRRPLKAFEDHLKELPQHLTQAEILIENYQHLLGFELELRSMRLSHLSFEEWDQLVSVEDITKYGLGIVIDTERLNL